ncbi:MAG: hypothetical protein HW386_939 [Gammaproteobacteria bacterium]|nr:hypothetical protein [Gammaproteobacteria bacterium]
MSSLTNLFIAYGNFLFRYRNYFFPLVLVIIVISTQPGTAAPEFLSTLSGVFVILFGQAIRAAVIGLDYIKRGGINKKVAAEHLVTTGIFAHCRNPLYVGNLLILCGLLILYDNLWAGLAGALFFYLSYCAIIMAEEAFLAAKFGDEYQDYCSRVPRWLFHLTGLYSTLAGNRFNWRRVISKDYTTMTTWMISLVLLLAVKESQLHTNWPVWLIVMVAAITVIVILALLYCIKRLKKSGYLTAPEDSC